MGVRTPEDPIVLFDGVCNLCSGYVQFVAPRDDEGRIRFASLQSDVAADLLADRGPDPDDLDSIVLIEGEDTYVKSDAVLRIAVLLGGPYRLAGPLRYVPRRFRDWWYDLVAANRYRIFGKKDRCEIPDGDVGARFVESTDDLEGEAADAHEDATGEAPADAHESAAGDD